MIESIGATSLVIGPDTVLLNAIRPLVIKKAIQDCLNPKTSFVRQIIHTVIRNGPEIMY